MQPAPVVSPKATAVADEEAGRRIRMPRGAAGWAARLLALVVILLAWWAAAAAKLWDPVFLPSPGAVLDRLVEAETTHDGIKGYSGYYLHEHLLISLRRIVIGSVVGTVAGIVIGLAIGFIPVVRLVLEPAVTFLRQLPPLAYFSLLIVWFGIDETPKVVLLMVAAMPPVAVATASAVQGIPRDYINGVRSLGAGRADVLRHVVVPGILPEIVVGIRLGVGVAYTSVVAAETVNGVPGIGGMIRDAQRVLQTDAVVLGILVLGATGILLDAGLRWVERRVGPWRGRA